MYRFSDVKRLHLELTTRCNASCPQCPRGLNGDRPNPHLPMAELALQDVQRMFSTEALAHIQTVLLCGNYGDPMVAKDLLPIIDFLRATKPSLKITMNTNGSAHKEEFWRDLATRIDTCTFALDGLEDTHAIYRRGTSWQRVIDNATTFIEAGGAATWDFIVFRHNEHQVEEARAMSQRLGFKRFVAKRTGRFLQGGKMVARTPVYDRQGNLEYYLEVPQSNAYLNDAACAADRLSQLPADGAKTQYDLYLAETPIDCRAWRDQQIYISAEGLVFPCCWTGALYNGVPRHSHPVWRLVDALPGGVADIDAKRTPLRDIIEGPFIQKSIPGGWEKTNDSRRLQICARACGKLDTWSAMYARSHTELNDKAAQ